jgi:DNA mismatch repair protein MutS2
MMTFLDRAVGGGLSPIFLVHGHGTGALRDAIRRELKDNRFVHHFRAGQSGEGGDGVTLVWVG